MKNTAASETQNDSETYTLAIQKTPQQHKIQQEASNRSKLRSASGRSGNQQDDLNWQQLQKFVNAHSSKLQEFFQQQDRLSLTQANFAWMRLEGRLGYHLGKTDWPNLVNISLVQNNLGPEGAEQLIKCRWPSVEMIDLKNNRLKNQGMKHLSRAEWPKLENLILNNNEIEGPGMMHFKTCTWFNLKQLNLSANRLGVTGMRALERMDLRFLDTLELRNCGLSSEAVRVMVCADWPQMILLNITMNLIGDEGVRVLSKSNWPKLQYIQLQYNQIRHGLRLLRGRWPQMKFPYLYGNKAHVQMIEATVQALIVKPAGRS